MRRTSGVVVIGLWLAMACVALGQGAAGQATVRGTVKTQQGVLIPGALVETASGIKLKTDALGRFEFSTPTGRLILIAAESGFESNIDIFEVKSNETVERDFVLKPSPDCPSQADSNPPQGPLSATDYVEVEYPDGMLAGYRVRLGADGEVLWRGAFAGGGWVFPGRASVPAQDAYVLIDRFRTSRFWSLCGGYQHPAGFTSAWLSDRPLSITTMQIGNRIHRVTDDDDTAPAFLRDLQRDFHMLVDTERWWRPRSTPIIPLVPNPGLTVDAVRRQFAGRDINARDSSGWTPLMYATQQWSSPDSMKAILDAGADPNARSIISDTVLMIAATAARPNPEWLKALIAAGADINAKDRDGRTALTLAVQRFALGGEPEIVAVLRKAGASTDIRDSHGMTTLDYFEQDAKYVSKYRQSHYAELRKILTEP